MSDLAGMFVLGYLLRKNMDPREIQTLTLAGAIKKGPMGGIYRTFATFHSVDKIAQNLVHRRVPNLQTPMSLFDICHRVSINRHHIKLNIFFPQILYLCKQWTDLDQILRYHCEIKK